MQPGRGESLESGGQTLGQVKKVEKTGVKFSP